MKLDTFINRPVLSTVISIFIVLLGLIGLGSLPVTQYPDIAPPTISVTTSYNGANAQAVLNSVIAPLEESINGAEGMTYIESTATNTGSATINVHFEQGFDPDMAAVDVQNRVAKAQNILPAEVTQVGVLTQKRQSSMLVGVALYSNSPDYDLEFLDNYMKINVIPVLQRVKGVGDVMSFGGDYSMRVWIKPEVMAQYGLTPTDIAAALKDQNIEAAPGSFGAQGNQSFQYTMKYRGRYETPEEFENIVVRTSANGDVLYLKDIADVELGKVTYDYSSSLNGKPGTMAIVFQTAGSNATEIINDCLEQVEIMKKDLPKGLAFAVPMNNNDFLYASIHKVISTLIEAFILVFFVVYVFLSDLRSTIIPAIAIPVALVGTFFVMKLIGFSVNLITLSALVLAIAIVVDDAIVVVEAVHAKLDAGYKSARKAACNDACVHPRVVHARNLRYLLPAVRPHHGNRHRFLGSERSHPLPRPLRRVPQAPQGRRLARQPRQTHGRCLQGSRRCHVKQMGNTLAPARNPADARRHNHIHGDGMVRLPHRNPRCSGHPLRRAYGVGTLHAVVQKSV